MTFKKRKDGWRQTASYEVNRAGKLIAILAYTNGRWYWYQMNRDPGEPVCNTILIAGSATTLDGCKAEIKEYFQKRDKERGTK